MPHRTLIKPQATLISGDEVDVLMAATDKLCEFMAEHGPAYSRGRDKVPEEHHDSYDVGYWSAIFDYLQMRKSGQLAEPEIMLINH